MPGSALDVALTNFTLWHSCEVRLDIGASEEQRQGMGGRERGRGWQNGVRTPRPSLLPFLRMMTVQFPSLSLLCVC